MTADPLGRRFDHDVGAVLDGPAEITTAAEGVVHNQGNAVAVGEFGETLEIGHIKAGVADCFDVESLGVLSDRRGEGRRLVAIDKVDRDAESGERDL